MMTATIMIHNGDRPPIGRHLVADGVDTGVLGFGDGKGTVCNVFVPHDKAMAMAACWQDRPSYDALLAFVEEVRDYKPTVVSGRRRDPQDDVDDMMPVNEFETLQADAEVLIGKRGAA